MKTNTPSNRRIGKNMKIVVIGGSGLIGKKLAKNLRQQGHEVLPASPSSGVNKLDRGGHFAAWEQPQLFVSEVRAGFKSLRGDKGDALNR